MKTKNLLLMGLISLGMLTACSNEDELGTATGNPEGNTYAQIAINIMNSNANPSTRAVDGYTGDTNEGTLEEYGINSIMVVLTDANDIATHIYEPGLEDEPQNNNKTTKRATKTFSVPAGSYKVYVLANYDEKALSPIIQNTTNMKNVFSILNASKLYTSNSFLMVNANAPETQSINAQTTTTQEFDDDGNAKAEGKEVVRIDVDIERVVAKVTFNQSTTTFNFNNVSGKKIGEATITGVGIINLNKKMFLIGEKKVATNWPGLGEEYDRNDDKKLKWYYPTDPNYTAVIDANNSNDILADFDQQFVPNDGFKELSGIFYTPENTMTATAQQNGQTTGVVYKVEFDFSRAAQGETPYTELSNTSSGTYNEKFQKAIIAENNQEITKDIFTTPESQDSKTFYTWKGLIFISKNAAALYKAIVETAADADGNTIVSTYTANKNNEEISTYTDGIAYYPVWVKHNPDSEAANEQDKYGVVRNHWYELTVLSIKSLGYTKPSYDPTHPEKSDDDEEALIQVLGTIKPWRLVKQNVEL